MNKLYNELEDLSNNEAFYTSIQEMNGGIYKIFLYRLASYTDFKEDGAIESRGIMFDITDPENPICVSRPMEKFWNHGECAPWPEHESTNWDNYTEIMAKEDGSLISSFIDHNGDLQLKSKGSLYSDQAIMAMDYLKQHQIKFMAIERVARQGYTVNMELVSPQNRIVLLYPETKLVILNIRNNETGEYLTFDEATRKEEFLRYHWVEYHTGINIADVYPMKDIEGFIFQHPVTGHKVKCKTDWYVALHRSIDDVKSYKRLLGVVLEEGSDDLRGLFSEHEDLIKIIDDFESVVFKKYNHIVAEVEKFYEENKDLSQKDYAIKGQGDMKWVFSLLMKIYNGKEMDYKIFVFKNREILFPDVDFSFKG